MNLSDIRNIGIIAHIDAGKTTTTERMLYYANEIHKLGEVDEGSATMDWMKEEKERGITITSAATTCHWKEKQINIVDTPGHIDFTGEVERSLRVLDGAVMIFSAVEGVESQSEAVWYQADKYNIPRIVYINKLDRVGADPYHCVHMIKERLIGHPLELQFPVGLEQEFHAVCDVLSNQLIEWTPGTDGSQFTVQKIPTHLKSTYEKTREKLLETISIEEDKFAEKYLANHFITPNELINTIRKLTIQKRFVPIFFGASLKNMGVQPLLDGIVHYLPSPSDRPLIEGSISPNDPNFCALVFKLQTDPHGKLAYLRIYSGNLKQGMQVFNANTGTKERISNIFLMHANKRKPLREAKAGDIVAVYGLKQARTGHTLTATESKTKLSSFKFPEPVISAKIEPKTHQDEEKFSEVLNNLSIDDPTVEIKTIPETGETLISGMGELHLQVLTQRMEHEFALHTKLGDPQVSYKEAITKLVQHRGKFIKQTGGRGQYGDVLLELKPLPRGQGFNFEVNVKNGAIPKEYWSSIRKGVETSMHIGYLAGFPLMDLEVTLIDGSYHSVDSSSFAFEMAASIAFKEAMKKAHPVLLEPLMKLEIVVPAEYLGNVLDDLNARGGKVSGLSGNELRHTILASCPLRKLFGYATDIRSITQGRAVHFMKFDKYQKLSQEEQVSVLKKIRGY